MNPAPPDDTGRHSFRPRWLRPFALTIAMTLQVGAIAAMTIPKPTLPAAEDSIELVIAQGAPEPEPPQPEPPKPEPPPPPDLPPPPPPDAPPPDLPPPQPEPEDVPPLEPPKVEVKEAPVIPIKPKPKPPPPKPRPPDPVPAPPEVKAPGQQEADADRTRAQQTYASKLLAEIRRHKPVVTATGSVVVSFSVLANGAMGPVSVVRSSGKDELDNAALQMVRAAHAEPPPDGHFGGTTTINFVDR
jgi:protein TonB